MNPENFVAQLRKNLVEDNLAIYRDLLETTNAEDASDPYWVRLLSMFAHLDEAGKAVLLELIRQVMVDTVSNVFAIIDGVSTLEGQDGEFHLTLGDSEEQLNGGLQDCFLAMEEEHG